MRGNHWNLAVPADGADPLLEGYYVGEWESTILSKLGVGGDGGGGGGGGGGDSDDSDDSDGDVLGASMVHAAIDASLRGLDEKNLAEALEESMKSLNAVTDGSGIGGRR